MAGKGLVEGATARTVRENIVRNRTMRDLSWAQMSRFLGQCGRPIAPLGLRRIEAGERRVDVDDLMAIAFVLNVTPLDLLLPARDSESPVEVTGLGSRPVADAWSWARGNNSVGSPTEGFPGGVTVFNNEELVGHVPEQVTAETSSDAFKDAVRAVVREMLEHEK